MFSIRIFSRTFASLVGLTIGIQFSCADAQRFELAESTISSSPFQQGELGTVIFPTTCSAEAQTHFLRGVAALHSFWYRVAIESFRAATQIDSNCMMGYWGEAMAYNHPIWEDPPEIEAARNVIKKIIFSPQLTVREQSWLHAVRILYGEGDKTSRDKAYAAAMEKIHHDYPDDIEAALFYALALMGTVQANSLSDVKTRLRAGEIARAVYQTTPNHPGAAHYIIHAYDDPEHAHLALNAARSYAEIAPAAPHALHMPAHIFLQLGMWPEAAASNEASWEASNNWVRQNSLPISKRYYHSLYWLMYAYLQQGRYIKAREMLTLMRDSLSQFPEDNPRDILSGKLTHAKMAATFLAETKQWDAAHQLLPSVVSNDEKNQNGDSDDLMQNYYDFMRAPVIFANGLAAANKGSPSTQKSIAKLQAILQQASNKKESVIAGLPMIVKIQILQIEAMISAINNNYDDAIKKMQQAITFEESMPPPSGPPFLIKPSHEMFGEILLQAGRPDKAAEQFSIALRRYQNRAHSLLGAARAAASSSKTNVASDFYAQFARQWDLADAQQPELQEAQAYLKKLGKHSSSH